MSVDFERLLLMRRAAMTLSSAITHQTYTLF